MPLTKRMAELMKFLDDYISTHGIAPSYDEMMEGLGLHSKSGIHRIIMALEARKFIERRPYEARTIMIIRGPYKSKRAWL